MVVLFVSKFRLYWCELLLGIDVCFVLVLLLLEVAEDEYIRVCECFVVGEGLL